MSGGVAAVPDTPLPERLRAFWMPMADTFAVLTALSLPWHVRWEAAALVQSATPLEQPE